MSRSTSRVAVAILLFAGALSSCGGPRVVPVDTLEGRVVGELVRLEGRLSAHGSSPFPSLVLEVDDGSVVILESETVKDDLRRLADMRVAVEGEIAEPMGERRVLEVLRYELVRLPNGEQPLIGTVSIKSEFCVLTTREGRRYWLRGDLVAAIADFSGARVWVTGKLGDPSDGPKGATPYWVVGYGVLSEPD